MSRSRGHRAYRIAVRAAMRSRIDLIFEKGFSIGLKSGE